MGREAGILKKLGRKLAHKWEFPHSKANNDVNSRMSVAIVIDTHHCLYGSRAPPILISYAHFICEYGAGIGHPQTEDCNGKYVH